jgi:hypothetical protein
MEQLMTATLFSPEFKLFFDDDMNAPKNFAVAYLTVAERSLFNCESDTVW